MTTLKKQHCTSKLPKLVFGDRGVRISFVGCPVLCMPKNLKIFGVRTANTLFFFFFRGSLPPETLKRVSIIFDYC